MIFSANRWNDADEMKRFVPVSSALSFENLESALRDAFDLFVIPILGEPTARRIVQIYQAAERSEAEALVLDTCQRAVANLAFWYDFDELSVRITDQGVQRQESDTFKSAYKYQEDNLRRGFKNKGFNALDRLIDLLDRHLAEFPEFAKAPAHDHRAEALVRSTAEVDRIYFINRSHLVFLRLQPIFRTVEQTTLRPLLGTKLYEALTVALASGKESIGTPGSTEDLRRRCADFVVLRSVAQLLRTTGSITDRGLYFSQVLPAAGSGESLQPVDTERLALEVNRVETSATAYEHILMTWIENTLPEYFQGRQSRVLDRDNDGHKTFFA
ncbi:MAG: DUF6712 family protein [Bacteroidaceae bacterium]